MAYYNIKLGMTNFSVRRLLSRGMCRFAVALVGCGSYGNKLMKGFSVFLRKLQVYIYGIHKEGRWKVLKLPRFCRFNNFKEIDLLFIFAKGQWGNGVAK